MTTRIGKVQNLVTHLSGEISERLPVVTDGLIAHFPFDNTIRAIKNHFEDEHEHHKFINWSGNGTYYKNIVQDGELFGNPVYRSEQSSSTSFYYYHYNIPFFPEAGEYVTFSCIAKSSTSNENYCPFNIYFGRGNPWTAGNYSAGQELWYKKEYLFDGFWKLTMCRYLPRADVAEVYRDNYYFGLKGTWSDLGQYVWGTCPMFYTGTTNHPYCGDNINSNNITLTQDGIVVEEPTTNQITISNMELYEVGYQGDVCGFSNNFDSRFGVGNWNREIMYEPNSPVNGLTKFQRIETYASGWGGWTSGNIGATSGNIVYGIWIRLWYGQIEWGDLNSSSRLYITTDKSKLSDTRYSVVESGKWTYVAKSFPATAGGRHLYANGITKADIMAVQIENKNYPTSYVNGSRINTSNFRLPLSIVDLYEGTIHLTITPKRPTNWNRIIRIGSYSDPITTDEFLCLFDDNDLNSVNYKDVGFQIRSKDSGNVVFTGYCVRLYMNEEAKLTISWSKSKQEIAIYKNGDLVNRTTASGSFIFPDYDSYNYLEIGSNSELNSVIRDLSIYKRALSDSEVKKLSAQPIFLNSDDTLIIPKLKELPPSFLSPSLAKSWAYSSHNLLNPDFSGFTGSGVNETKDFFGETIPVRNMSNTGNYATYSEYVEIDPNKWYMFSVWVFVQQKLAGNNYFGLYAYDSAQNHIGVVDNSSFSSTNPYFWYSSYSDSSKFKYNQWYQLIGYLIPSTTTANNLGWEWYNKYIQSGMYIHQMKPENKFVKLRFLDYYNNNQQSYSWWALPCITEISPLRIFEDKVALFELKEGQVL